MEFGVLGPVEVRHDGRNLPTGSARERFVLATLLLNAGRLVGTDRLVNGLWSEPPASARAQLHNMVSKIRSRLKGIDDALIATRSSGYQLDLGPHHLDLTQFRGHVADARQAAAYSDHATTAAILDRALRVWRGPALADVPDELAADTRQALAGELLAAAEAKLNAELALGRYDDVLRDTVPLLADHPYSEHLYRLQMSALVGAGRRADALAAYRKAYRRFTDDLGVEPGPVLRELEQRILRGDPVIDPVLPRVVPRQLPALNTTVTGRDELLDQITSRLAGSAPAVPPMAVLVGPGGIGKTALTLAAGRRLEARYPDGQLYADLRGSHARPADPHEVAGRFLRALGVDGGAVPEDPDERIAMYRSHLAGGRMLVVLDDAADESQVRPLLPGAPSCGALVTSRRQLAALMGVARFTVPQLSHDDAVRLLARLGGAERVAEDPRAASRIVRLCGGLPLAVCIVAARLAVRPDWRLADFRDRLAAERGRLNELAVGDLDVRASIGLSYRALPAGAQRLFRRLGLLVTPTWPAWVAEELAGPHSDGGDLERLTDVHLVESVGTDGAGQHRYRLHDLVADFAAELRLAEQPDEQRSAAVGRVLAGWLALATEADESIGGGTSAVAGTSAPAGTSDAAVALVRAAPYEWFEAERGSLVDAVASACRSGDAETAGALALRLNLFLAVRGYDTDRERVLRVAADCVRARGPDDLLARLLCSQFEAAGQRDRRAELPRIAEEALTVARRAGNPELELRALSQAARAARMGGRFSEAEELLRTAVATARDSAPPRMLLATVLEALGNTYAELGQPEPALPLLEEAIAICRSEGQRRRAAQALYSYAGALLVARRLSDAADAAAEALGITRSIGDEVGTAFVELVLADVHLVRGEPADAARRLEHSRGVLEQRGNQSGIASALQCQGDLALVEERPQDALPPLLRSVRIWRAIDLPVERARSLVRLEVACRATGDRTAAADYRWQWRAILDELKLDEACLRRPPFL